MFAGGCAGAGPTSGFSGWKSTSGAVDERDAADAGATGGAPRPRRQRDRVAGLRLQRRGELLVEHDRPARSGRAGTGTCGSARA